MDQEFGSGFAGWFWLRVPHESVVRKPERVAGRELGEGLSLGQFTHIAIGREPSFSTAVGVKPQFLATWASP